MGIPAEGPIVAQEAVVVSKRRDLFKWSTRNILLVAATGIVFGLVFVGQSYFLAVTSAVSPVIGWAWLGLYMMPSLFIGYILRKPGSALLTAVLYSLVQLVFSPYGPLILINCAMYSICGELGIALGTRYRSFSLPWLLLSGLCMTLLTMGVYLIFWPDALLAFDMVTASAVWAAVIASGLVAAVIAKGVADGVARTGALSGTALHEKQVQEV